MISTTQKYRERKEEETTRVVMEYCDFKEKVWKCLTKVVFEQRLKSSDRVGHGVTERRI